MSIKKVGIMGGTFNPIHKGHLAIANQAYTQFSLDEIWVMPSKLPPHKAGAHILSADDRIQMVRLALNDAPHLKLSLFEMEREGYTYTYDTLERLHMQYPDTEFYFIMGGDSLRDFHLWKHPERISPLCTLLVACREEIMDQQMETCFRQVMQTYQAKVLALTCPPFAVSSSQIRQILAEGGDASSYLDPQVYAYIRQHQLYQEKESDFHG